MHTIVSGDRTPIAFDRRGSGPPLVLVDGALCCRRFGPMPSLARLLADRFTVLNYDRRGRGDSGDSGDYAVERELEDLGGLLAECDGPASVFGLSAGAALALRAAAAGLPISRLALYEAPYGTGDERRRELLRDYPARLAQLLTAGQRAAAIELFLELVDVPVEVVTMLRRTSRWPVLEQLAPTLAYDSAVLDQVQLAGALPRPLLAAVHVPTLVLAGGASSAPMRETAGQIARLLPRAGYRTLAEQTHDVDPGVLAPVLADFFGPAPTVASTEVAIE
ncbi:MAG: alpha/beta fold hydrolase [Jatrophihabitans sp.]